jgi:alpha-1,2-mannosyltransferase
MSTAGLVRPVAGRVHSRFVSVATAVIGLAVVAAFWTLVLAGAKDRALSGHNDFVCFYSGGRLAFSPGLYDAQAEMRQQREAVGFGTTQFLFTRPPWEAALCSLLAKLPFLPAYILWTFLGASAIFAGIAIWPGLPRSSAYSLLAAYAPAVFAVTNGQDVQYLLLIMAGSAALANSGMLFGAGFLLALGQFKFHLLLPAALMLVAGRRWRVLAGGAAGTAALAIASAWVAGWNWPVRYLAAIFRPSNNDSFQGMPTLYYALRALPYGAFLWVFLVLAATWAIWQVGRKGNIADMLAISPALAIPLVNHVFSADATLVFPLLVITLLAAKNLPLRLAAIALISPVIWLLSLGGWPWSFLVAALILGIALTFAATLRTNTPNA